MGDKHIDYCEMVNGKTIPTYKEEKSMKQGIDKDIIIDSLKSKIKYEEGRIEDYHNKIAESENAIKKCKDQITKLVQGE